jgi:hypothetical protein
VELGVAVEHDDRDRRMPAAIERLGATLVSPQVGIEPRTERVVERDHLPIIPWA